jgi:hypothetical protein
MDRPVEPLIFTKFTSSVIAGDDAILIDPTLTERVDWEVELAVVIGRTARNIDASVALDQVAGYTAANDVSARDLQFRDGQWVRGKSLDTFCPLGPVLVTPDEIDDYPQNLAVQTVVNGEVMQDSNTKEMIFDVATLISYCSRSFTLNPGDVILTGTPWGCGEFMSPKRSLSDGDLVTVSVQGIGQLSNPGPIHLIEEADMPGLTMRNVRAYRHSPSQGHALVRLTDMYSGTRSQPEGLSWNRSRGTARWSDQRVQVVVIRASDSNVYQVTVQTGEPDRLDSVIDGPYLISGSHPLAVLVAFIRDCMWAAPSIAAPGSRAARALRRRRNRLINIMDGAEAQARDDLLARSSSS